MITIETKQTHTPGPWVIAHKSNMRDGGIWAEAECVYVGQVYHIGRQTNPSRSGEREANARLMAAAPEMLEALVQADLQIEYMQEKFRKTGTGNSVRSQIQAAIQKAKGSL